MPGMMDMLVNEITALRSRVEALETQERQMAALALTDGVTAPSTESGVARVYVDTSDGDLKVKFGDGTTKTIATDT